MNIIAKYIPNTITCLNLVSGCFAIMMSFFTAETFAFGWLGWQWAVAFIFAAAVFDFFDGFAARCLHAYSEIGKELDSLSDLVSFGVAPAFLLFNILNLLHPVHASSTSGIWIHCMVFLIPVMGALRLARFNVRDAESDNSVFHGLPIPANALFWIGYVSWVWNYGLPEDYVVAIGILLISFSMVSNLVLPSLKFKNLRFKGNVGRYFIIAVTIALVSIFGLSGLIWAIIVYLVMGVFTPSPKAKY